MAIHCCYGCTPETGRSTTCHGTCKKYLEEKAEHEAKKAENRSKVDSGFYDYARGQAVRRTRIVKKYYRKG